MSDDDRPTQTILSDTQKKLLGINPIPGAAETGANVINDADTALADLDTITTYLQPLKTFNTVVNGIANVSFVA